MEDVVLVSGVRTAIGTFNGSLANTPANELGSTVISEAVNRAGIEGGDVDQIIMGIVGQVAEDAYLSRVSGIKAGIPVETPAVNVNRLCGSGLEAINTAARYIETGDADVVVAGGSENMTRLPFYLRKARSGYRLGHDEIQDGIVKLLSDPFEDTHMGITAEKLAEEYEISRTAQDEFSAESQRRALNAIEQRLLQGPDRSRHGARAPRGARLRHGRVPPREHARPARQAAPRLQEGRHGDPWQRQRHQRRRRRHGRDERGQGGCAGREAPHAAHRPRRSRRRPVDHGQPAPSRPCTRCSTRPTCPSTRWT